MHGSCPPGTSEPARRTSRPGNDLGRSRATSSEPDRTASGATLASTSRASDRSAIIASMSGNLLAAWVLGAALGGGDRAERIEVLFLGDRGHHQPEARCDQVAGALARLGIDLWFRADLDLLGHEPTDLESLAGATPPDRLKHVDAILL